MKELNNRTSNIMNRFGEHGKINVLGSKKEDQFNS